MDESKRRFIKQSVGLLAASGLVAGGAKHAEAVEPPEVPPSMKVPGAGMGEYGSPAKYESKVTRTLIRSQPGTTGSGASRTPLESLEGMITPSGLHFERHHSGVPDIDPDTHRLLIHGLVKRPLIFTVDALLRYPMVSRIHFLECSGNSQVHLPAGAAESHRRSDARARVVQRVDRRAAARCCSRRPASTRARSGCSPKAPTPPAMSRSVPMAKAMDDAILALYQNGERLRPENGYPVRLFLPGWEGNMSVKWLRRLKVVTAPIMTKDETSQLHRPAGATASRCMFTYPMEVKSVITRPSHGTDAAGRRALQISGIAWSGDGTIRQVEVSADGGRTWAEAALVGARAAEGAHAVPDAVEVGRRPRPCSSRAPPTIPGPCSRSARSSSPSTATTPSSTITASRPGAWRRTAR